VRDSSHFTDSDYVALDISDIVDEFIDGIDGMVCDMNYGVEEILLLHPRYRNRKDDIQLLAEEFTNNKIVSDLDDALLIAAEVLSTLYPKIDARLHEFGYPVCGIQRANLKLSRMRRISCHVILAVI